MIDFGLSKRYVDHQGHHILRTGNKGFRGTLRYCSVNMHNGIENTRRDDLESLAYVLLYLLKGSLPWMNRKVLLSNEGSWDMKMTEVMRLKSETRLQGLCDGLDKGFLDMLVHVKSLAFQEEPQYEKVKINFKDILKRNNLK